MKVATITTAVVAALAVSATAVPSFAQDYRGYGYRDDCQEKVHNSGTTGALLGGIAGALIGSNLASHHGGRSGGAVLGGLAGAAVGNNIARSSAKSSGACEGGYYGRSAYYGDGYQRRSYDSGRYAPTYAPTTYGYNRGYTYDDSYRYGGGYRHYDTGYRHYDGDYYRPY